MNEDERLAWLRLARTERVSEFRFYTRGRQPVWVSCADAPITDEAGRVTAVVRSFRDITRQKEAQSRRAAAAVVAEELSDAEDLDTVLAVARHGFELLFDGGSTSQLDLDERFLFSGGRRVTEDELTEAVRVGLAGTTSADATNPRPGILILPRSNTIPCRVWVQFPQPRLRFLCCEDRHQNLPRRDGFKISRAPSDGSSITIALTSEAVNGASKTPFR